jgi:hypothetical protein
VLIERIAAAESHESDENLAERHRLLLKAYLLQERKQQEEERLRGGVIDDVNNDDDEANLWSHATARGQGVNESIWSQSQSQSQSQSNSSFNSSAYSSISTSPQDDDDDGNDGNDDNDRRGGSRQSRKDWREREYERKRRRAHERVVPPSTTTASHPTTHHAAAPAIWSSLSSVDVLPTVPSRSKEEEEEEGRKQGEITSAYIHPFPAYATQADHHHHHHNNNNNSTSSSEKNRSLFSQPVQHTHTSHTDSTSLWSSLSILRNDTRAPLHSASASSHPQPASIWSDVRRKSHTTAPAQSAAHLQSNHNAHANANANASVQYDTNPLFHPRRETGGKLVFYI